MDATTKPAVSLGDAMPWVRMTMDLTDKLAELVPDELLDWRPVDPSGKWSFSLVEIVKHITDSRLMFVSQLAGSDVADGYWSDGPGEDGVWQFAEHRDKAEVLARLAATRAGVEDWLNKPGDILLEVTDGTRATFAKNLEQMRKAGAPTEDWERRGPATVNRVLMALAVHEAGHRGTLHALLRQQGINVSGTE